MLYSSVVPFYNDNGIAWNNLSFDIFTKMDERNDYAFTVPYKRVIHYDRSKNSLAIPSFYIYTGIEYDSALPIRLETIRILLSDGSVVTATQSQAPHSSFDTFFDSFVIDKYNNEVLAVSPPSTLILPNGWPLGPMCIVLQLFQANQVIYYYYYSDRLYITDDIHNYIELSWWNDNDLLIGKRNIPYSLGYRPSCLVDALLGKPEYSFEEEMIDRLGYKFVQSAISKKTYRFSFIAPEYLCDSVRIMRICNNKIVTRYDLPNYGEQLEPMTMGLDVSWDDQGHLALIDVALDVDLVTANPSGYLPLQTGDFNNDYNNDFSNY